MRFMDLPPPSYESMNIGAEPPPQMQFSEIGTLIMGIMVLLVLSHFLYLLLQGSRK